LIHQDQRLGLSEVRLYDLDREHLALITALGQAMARAARAGLKVTAATSLEQALDGTDAVLNSTRPGGFAARRLDELIPVEFDVPGQETVGPGGFFFALRSVPEARRVREILRQRSPGAWLLNYTNPTNIVTQALLSSGDERVLGLCDQSEGDLETLRVALGRPGPVSFRSVGTNHATWYQGLHFGGRPVELPLDPAGLSAVAHHDEEHAIRFELSVELARKSPGYWPNSYLPYYTHPQRFVAHTRQHGPRTDAIVAKLPFYYAHFREEAAKEVPELRHHRGTAGFGDMAVEVLAALIERRGQRVVLNVKNGATSRDFSPDTVIETFVELGPRGPIPEASPRYPEAFTALKERIESYQRAAARAACGGSEQDKIGALAENPLIRSRAVAEAMWARAKSSYGKALE
jgi:6-phospho-beta-glucosidase